MKPVESKSTEHWLSELCTRLGTCQSVEHVQHTLGNLDNSIFSEGHTEAVLHGLQAHPQSGGLIELVLSGGSCAEPLSDWLLENFPQSIDVYLSSIHKDVIEALSLFLAFLPPTLDTSFDEIHREFRVRVELTPKVMKGLIGLIFEEQADSPIPAAELESSELLSIAITRKKKQSAQKQARKGNDRPTTLRLPDLQRLGIPKPRSSLEANAAAQCLLNNMKEALQAPATMSMTEPAKGEVDDSVRVCGTVHGDPTPDSAYPYVQPMKAALYFDSAKGFGPWRILISSRADRNLREARRRDRHNFEIYVKKIKELSHGHFSADNHKRLNGADLEVPVYEAKMTGDTRLVYQIDCIPDYDSNIERQVIRIFGIYTHAQLGKRLWSSMGSQLARKGREYQRRCIARKRAQAGDNIFEPEHFVGAEKITGNHESDDAAIIPELPKEDLEEIHSLVLDKFVPLSKELWIGILADLDIAHVFDVTPEEREIIEHPYSCYVLGRSGTGKTTTMLFKMLGIERCYVQRSQSLELVKPRQVFVTQSRFLATRVEEYFSKLLESLATAGKTKQEIKELVKRKEHQQAGSAPLFDIDDDINWKATLPSRFSLLQDEHFPLFLTFERLAQLLEGDIEVLRGETPSRSKPHLKGEGQLLDYYRFLEKYWPHFPQHLTKHLDPALAYSELLGVIKGSEGSLSHETRYLDESSYKNSGRHYVPANQRDRIYSLFKAYLKHKRKNGDLDVADRTHGILKAFEADGVPGTKVDYLYVDEVQDNQLIDAMLLRSLCRNSNGLFWAGDTAQTIAMGSSFRFDDLKAFLYRLEQRRAGRYSAGEVAQSELRTFQLVTNYRSHSGIVRCAKTVVDIISRFWPHAIDNLAPEQGVVEGGKPAFFNNDSEQYEQFLSGDSGERVEFGASQCILVRDGKAKLELREQVGNIGIILTVYESKGLEFDDVLLYRFFEDSKLKASQWRLVLNLLSEYQSPQFDEERHVGLCAELKILYVAITRSRKHLWIVDGSDKAVPMKMLWEAKGLIEQPAPGINLQKFAKKSSPEQWAKSGRSLFDNRQYLEAKLAFERASMSHEADVADAHHLRQVARLAIPTMNKENMTRLSRRNAFRDAALAFSGCAATSASTEEERIFLHNTGECYEQAGNCGESAEDYANAARAYAEAREFSAAVKLYRKVEMFDEAVEIIQAHPQDVDLELAQTVFEVARLFYFRRKEYRKAKNVFNSVEEQLEYLEENILLDECHADVLVELGKYQKAADIHIEEGRIMDAIEVLLSDNQNPKSVQRANDYILQGLWQSASFAMKISDDDPAAARLLSLASKASEGVLSQTQRDEISMFQFLSSPSEHEGFRDLGYEFMRRDEKLPALLCLDHFFIDYDFQALTDVNSPTIWSTLQNFHDYCFLFREIVASLDLADEGMQKLFNFQPASIENAYRVRTGTWLYDLFANAEVGVLESDDECVIVLSVDLLQTLKSSLWERLAARIRSENEVCQLAQLWTPCLFFTVDGECPDSTYGCARQHLLREQMTQEWFNDQLRGVFLQIMIYQIYHSIPIAKDREETDVRRLYETLNPPLYYMGSHASLRLEDIAAQAQPATEIVKNWCRDILYTRDADKDRMTLSFVYEAAALCLLFDHFKAIPYLQQAPLLGIFENLHLYRRPTGVADETAFIVLELYQCLLSSDVNFVTAGILFFEQVVSQRITIDLNLLCHFFEFLTGSTILARRRFNLHYATLPRSWFQLLLHRIVVQEADTILLDRLVQSLKQLLHDLILGGVGGDYLLFEGSDVAERHALRHLFVPRVCRALGLLGYNIRNERLRLQVFQALKLLDPARTHHAFKRFAGRYKWGGVVVTTQESYSGSQLDDLVQLYSLEKQSGPPKEPPAGVHRVFFTSREQVPEALAKSSLRPDAPEFIPRAKLTTSESNEPGALREEEDDESLVEQANDQPEADSAELVDSRNLVEALVSTATPLVGDAITDEQKAVARKLLEGYRRMANTRAVEKSKTRTQMSCDSFFSDCLQASRGMEWGKHALYKKIYIGVVPHLLTCLDAVQSYAHASKKKAHKRLLDKSERDLDGLKQSMDELNAMFKSSKTLRKQLDPSSAMHKECNMWRLKQVVEDIVVLLERVPIGDSLSAERHLDIAVKGILKKPEIRIPKRERDLELNNNNEDHDGDGNERLL